eukprot:gnl/TRDRNA2_/TRDRNA2_142696_c0_seq4.p1 gnl/TRDRNA2_/TRDRNA2_142696_c0~~gnl/TRDRNA2_/TRDRNA2_142696_c0_seq4.p1  ORF type:complete len:340 (+),score=38.57 gnl/TRDRNA2_/TRDRNA2_142696_c0_seq4:107-1021(+)
MDTNIGFFNPIDAVSMAWHWDRLAPSPAGLPAVEASAASVSVVATTAARFQLPFNASYPGLRLLHADPPVILVDDFLPLETCAAVVDSANASGLLTPSRVSRGTYVGGQLHSAVNSPSKRRTCFSMWVTDDVLGRCGPALASAQQELRDNLQALLPGCRWAAPGPLTPGRLFFEELHLSRYTHGQHFLAHEDSFRSRAETDGIQRRATLLVYLNDVLHGGETRFEHLGVSIRPTAGTALLFFPAFANGSSDVRLLHSGTAAVDEKWIAQQWVAARWSHEAVTERSGASEDSLGLSGLWSSLTRG